MAAVNSNVCSHTKHESVHAICKRTWSDDTHEYLIYALLIKDASGDDWGPYSDSYGHTLHVDLAPAQYVFYM